MAGLLICDDALFVRGALSKIVTEDGHRVLAEASDGEEAIRLYKAYKPDLVMMDITMPDMDGIQATRKIIAFDPNAKIIMVSAMGQMEKVVEAITAGATDFIVKPFDEEHVKECIKKYSPS
ncbi:MAG: response regulator [Lachnospiraceae bacterium]|nr:response regulator [Lachnospiraceae bacterium]